MWRPDRDVALAGPWVRCHPQIGGACNFRVRIDTADVAGGERPRSPGTPPVLTRGSLRASRVPEAEPRALLSLPRVGVTERPPAGHHDLPRGRSGPGTFVDLTMRLRSDGRESPAAGQRVDGRHGAREARPWRPLRAEWHQWATSRWRERVGRRRLGLANVAGLRPSGCDPRRPRPWIAATFLVILVIMVIAVE